MDGDFMSASEKNLIESHVEVCPYCAEELSKLRRLVTMVSCLKGICINEERELPASTLRLISERSRRLDGGSALKRHFIPAFAVAAIVIGVVGISIFTTDTLNNFSKSSHLALEESGRAPASPSSDPASRVMQMIRNSDARILKVSDDYVIGETTQRNVGKLKRDMQDYRIQFMSRVPRRDVMNVSAGGGGDSFNVSTPGMVQFKIFVK